MLFSSSHIVDIYIHISDFQQYTDFIVFLLRAMLYVEHGMSKPSVIYKLVRILHISIRNVPELSRGN